MQKRKCVQDAVAHKKTSYAPYNIELTKDLQAKVENKFSLNSGEFFEFTGNHIEKCGFEGGEFIVKDVFKDDFGVEWDRTGVDKDIGIIHDYMFKDADISQYQFPIVDKRDVKNRCDKFFNDERETYQYAKIGTTLFERAWSLRGFQNLFMDFLLEPSFVQSLMTKIVDHHMDILNVALNYDFDGVYFGDDYGQQSGMMMSPDIWRKLIKPHLKRMFDKVKASGKTVCLHSCGDIKDVLPDLIEIGLDVYQTVQPEIYDLEKLKKEFGKDLAFYGAISTQRDLPFKKPSEIKEIIKGTIDILGKNGGYIVAPTHRVTGDTPLENVVAMIEAFKNQKDW